LQLQEINCVFSHVGIGKSVDNSSLLFAPLLRKSRIFVAFTAIWRNNDASSMFDG
jgi:hypothetical protein